MPKGRSAKGRAAGAPDSPECSDSPEASDSEPAGLSEVMAAIEVFRKAARSGPMSIHGERVSIFLSIW